MDFVVVVKFTGFILDYLKSKSASHSVVSDSLRPHGLKPARLPCLWNSPGKNIGVRCHSLVQGIFPTQGLNPGLLHHRRILYHLSLDYLTGPNLRILTENVSQLSQKEM